MLQGQAGGQAGGGQQLCASPRRLSPSPRNKTPHPSKLQHNSSVYNQARAQGGASTAQEKKKENKKKKN